jgi:hypothetical protein
MRRLTCRAVLDEDGLRFRCVRRIWHRGGHRTFDHLPTGRIEAAWGKP